MYSLNMQSHTVTTLHVLIASAQGRRIAVGRYFHSQLYRYNSGCCWDHQLATANVIENGQ
jgi:hypothetical protein